ncbi:MAG: acyltransferase [Desulfuromonadales bacterium]|nr:acyltransferase [Desulfuromonadales bacterium]
MLDRLKRLLGGQQKTATTSEYPCRTQGRVHLLERHGGRIEVDPSAFLNSLQEGYHVGMPFETTLIADAPEALIRIGEGCRIHGVYIHAWERVTLGKKVLVAAGTTIVDSNGHSTNIRHARFRQNFKDQAKPINIGDYVWIGMNSLIFKGVEIGECAIVSAGSVVKDSVPAFSVVEGNPARVVHVYDPNEALPADYPLEKLSSEKGFFIY